MAQQLRCGGRDSVDATHVGDDGFRQYDAPVLLLTVLLIVWLATLLLTVLLALLLAVLVLRILIRLVLRYPQTAALKQGAGRQSARLSWHFSLAS